MKYIDTHCHLYDEAFDSDRAEALQRAEVSGVTTLLLPDIDSKSTPQLDAMMEQWPGKCHAMSGLHPTSVGSDYETELDHVHQRLTTPGRHFVAVGEIGLDYYWDTTFREQQLTCLRQQMLWAEEMDLPVCLHIRKAMNDVFGLLRDLNRGHYRGVMHCFGGSVQEAMHAIEMGFYIGVGGVVTFKNATLASVARAVPLDRIVLETDAPYLSPVPHRGKRNESAYIPLIARCIAELRGIGEEEVAATTTLAAQTLFALPQTE